MKKEFNIPVKFKKKTKENEVSVPVQFIPKEFNIPVQFIIPKEFNIPVNFIPITETSMTYRKPRYRKRIYATIITNCDVIGVYLYKIPGSPKLVLQVKLILRNIP